MTRQGGGGGEREQLRNRKAINTDRAGKVIISRRFPLVKSGLGNKNRDSARAVPETHATETAAPREIRSICRVPPLLAASRSRKPLYELWLFSRPFIHAEEEASSTTGIHLDDRSDRADNEAIVPSSLRAFPVVVLFIYLLLALENNRTRKIVSWNNLQIFVETFD